MHYYPEGEELKDACKKLRLYSVCRECSGELVVRYDLIKHREYIICNNNDEHEGLRKTWPDTLKEIRREFSMDSIALMKLDKPEMTKRIEQAKWPADLKPDEKALVVTVALSYGLDPILNELSIYQGRPYPTINAWYRKAQETGQFDGMDSRPATKEEREARNVEEGDFLYRCEVYRKGGAHPFVGWGRVTKAETKPGSRKQGDTTSTFKPIQNNPDRMCEKRSEMQALRKAFSIPMPTMSFEEIPGVGKVNTGTGEIIVTQESRDPLSEALARKVDSEMMNIAEKPPPPEPPPTGRIDMPWLIESVNTLKWDILQYIKDTYKVEASGNLGNVVDRLSDEQVKELSKEVQDRLDMR